MPLAIITALRQHQPTMLRRLKVAYKLLELMQDDRSYG